MSDRKIVIGTYNTFANYWTLNSWKLSEPTFAENYAKVPGRSGALDLSTILTDGEPSYDNRTFTARLESSEGTRLERETRIDNMINALHGQRLNIILPDDPTRYITGRVSVSKEYNDVAHAAVNVKATCDPWRYSETERVITLTSTTQQQTTLTNLGRRPVIPTIKVTGGSFSLWCNTWSQILMEGTYVLPNIYLPGGGTAEIAYLGPGTATFTYREAVL